MSDSRLRRISSELDEMIKKQEQVLKRELGKRKGLGVAASRVLARKFKTKPKLQKTKKVSKKWEDTDLF